MNKQLAITRFSNQISEAAEIIISDIPSPGADEVLVKNKWVGINAIYDRELYKGNVPYINVEFPYVMGVEAVGEVISVGSNVSNLVDGDSVSTVKVGTAYQEYQVVSKEIAVKIPAATPDYLAINPTGISAALAVEKTAQVKEGETVVVSAAAGGLGHFIVQLCKLKGCHVVGICGSEQKVELLESLKSCDRTINYRKESITDVLAAEYQNMIDVGFDSVGQHMFDAFLPNLAPLGRLVVCGLAAELTAERFQIVTQPRVYESIYWKGASVRCFMNHLYKEDHLNARKVLHDAYLKERIKVKVDPTHFEGIEAIIDASRYLLEGRSIGKVVVQL